MVKNHLITLQRLEGVRLIRRHENHFAPLHAMWFAGDSDFRFAFEHLH